MTPELRQAKHPLGTRNKPIHKRDHETLEAAVWSALRRTELTHTDLLDDLTRSLSGNSSGNIGWHVMVVKLDLEARKLIERTSSRPQRHRLKQP